MSAVDMELHVQGSNIGALSQLSTGMLLPDAVHRICQEGQALQWDSVTNCYVVIDGNLFEQRFDELRRKRDRDDGSNGRPFSRMHKYYKLEFGERWAKTGARFSPKDPLLLRRMQAMPASGGGLGGDGSVVAGTYNGGAMSKPSLDAFDIDQLPAFGTMSGMAGDSPYDSGDTTCDNSVASPPENNSDVTIPPLPGDSHEHAGHNALGGGLATVDVNHMQDHAYQVINMFAQQRQQQHQHQQQHHQQQGYAAAGQQSFGDVGVATGFKRARVADGVMSGDGMGGRMFTGSGLVHGSQVMVKLRNHGRAPLLEDTFEVSLQTFLDTIDAGGEFIKAQSLAYSQHVNDHPDPTTKEASPSLVMKPEPNVFGMKQGHGSFFSASSTDSDISFAEMDKQYHGRAMAHYNRTLSINTMHTPTGAFQDNVLVSPALLSVERDHFEVGNLWTQHSRGDQAYFFFRGADVGGFSNGSVVALKQGQLVPATSSNILEAEMLLVVSDLNAKWKGEPYPSPEQEEEGHWCAFLGQVPLWVDGPVKAGEYLGPVGDGSGLAKVVEVGIEPAVGMALDSKGAGLGCVKSMVSVGLNALNTVARASEDAHGRSEAESKNLMARLEEASSKVEDAMTAATEATKLARQAKVAAKVALSAAERAEAGVGRLTSHMDVLQDEVRDNRSLLEDLDSRSRHVSRRQYLWSCLCGLMSIKVTESAGPWEDKTRGDGGKWANPGLRADEKSQYDLLPSGPQEVEASCVGRSSACMGIPGLQQLQCPMMKRAMRWAAEAVIVDTTINLALTCILMKIAHAAGLDFTLQGLLTNLAESAIHIVTLAYLFLPCAAVVFGCVNSRIQKARLLHSSKHMDLPTSEGDRLKAQTDACKLHNVRQAIDALCPFRSVKSQTFLLLVFWYMVAAHIAYTYSQANQSSAVAPFGYWYLIVLTLKSTYQVGVRQTSLNVKWSSDGVRE